MCDGPIRRRSICSTTFLFSSPAREHSVANKRREITWLVSLKKPLSENMYTRGKRRRELTFTLASRSVGEPALPSCTFMSAADEPLPVLDVGDVRLFSHEFEDEFLQTPPAPAIELSPASDLFCEKKKKKKWSFYATKLQRNSCETIRSENSI